MNIEKRIEALEAKVDEINNTPPGPIFIMCFDRRKDAVNNENLPIIRLMNGDTRWDLEPGEDEEQFKDRAVQACRENCKKDAAVVLLAYRTVND